MHDWAPGASLDMLQQRAALINRVRGFFSRHGLLEVTTPVLSTAAATDPALRSMAVDRADGSRHWLHTSPEFPMKRLLAAGSGDIWQLCTVFRDGETGRWHNPEFMLLEWYRLGYDDLQMAAETVALIRHVMGDTRGDAEYVTYRDAFMRHAGVDPLSDSDQTLIEAALGAIAVSGPVHWTRAEWLDLLGSALVYPALGRGRITVLTDYPAEQAALARLKPGNPKVAARFEVFVDGVEVANGFHELADAAEQRRRFVEEQDRRRAAGDTVAPLDERLLAALEHGLPNCAGVALGVDRLIALTLGARSLAEVIAFTADRA